MYLLYLDDSGSANNENEEHLVLGGFAVFERRPYYITQELDRLASSLLPSDPDAVEFHASEIFRGKTPPWDGLKREARIKAISDVLGVLVNEHETTCAFACAVHKKSFPHEDPMALAFEEVCNRFDRHLLRKGRQEKHRKYASEEQQRGMIVFDESAYETTIQKLAANFRKVGTRWGVTRTICEVPVFLDSKASRCIQLADHIAYSVFRRYEASDAKYLDPVLSRFDLGDDGKLHGLVHKHQTGNCMCPACMSRLRVA